MSDKPSNYELDDELLSAYVDGELSADERAAIEARLANDPAAQQLLHELRSVSQSVQALPTESLGRDLSEEIIRRARDAAPTPARAPSAKVVAATVTSRSVDATPKIRIFNSRRAWIWASMALAASLLIMIVQPGDDAAKKLPPVAVRNQEAAQTQPVAEAGKPVRRERAFSASPNSKSPSPATVASETEVHEKVDAFGGLKPAAPMSSEPLAGQLGTTVRDDVAAGPPIAAASPAAKPLRADEKIVLGAGSASSTVTALPDQVATDKSTAAPQPTGRVGGFGDALDLADAKQKSESVVNQNAAQRFLVVRVVAKPDALKSGSFDRLLANNNIKFVPQPAKAQSLGFGGGKLDMPAKNENVFNERLAKSSEGQAADMVLVEAPAPTIELCLAELNENENDFLSINVIEDPQSHDRFDAKSTPNKKLAQTSRHLSDFNRGNVPEAQKDAFDSRKYFYSYDFDKPNDPVVNGSPRAGGSAPGAAAISGVRQETDGAEASANKNQRASEIGRARRIDTRGIDNQKAGEPAGSELSILKSASGRAARVPSEAIAANQPMSQRTPNEQAEAKGKADNQNNNWKVLFVFTSDEAPAPSAPSDDRPK